MLYSQWGEVQALKKERSNLRKPLQDNLWLDGRHATRKKKFRKNSNRRGMESRLYESIKPKDREAWRLVSGMQAPTNSALTKEGIVVHIREGVQRNFRSLRGGTHHPIAEVLLPDDRKPPSLY